jgi:hypothetical protein
LVFSLDINPSFNELRQKIAEFPAPSDPVAQRGEMATPRHFRSLHDVEVLIDSTFGRSDRFLWEYGSC